MHGFVHIFHGYKHILICTTARRRAVASFDTEKERDNMENNTVIQITRPQQPQPREDLDDLIFAGDCWQVSDR